MNYKIYTAGINDNDRRADRIIRKLLKEKHMSEIYKAFRTGQVKINGNKIKPAEKVHTGDSIAIDEYFSNVSIAPIEKTNSHIKYETLFVNDNIQIINKPYNTNVHGDNSLTSAVVAEWNKYCKKQTVEHSLSFTPGPLHRLDKRTTGIIVFSRSLNGARWFSQAVKDHTIFKIYIALIQGHPQNKQIWEDSLSIQENISQSAFHTMKITNDTTEKSKIAITEMTPLAYGKYFSKDVTLAQFIIKTGRKHQIRLQSSFHGFPLLGDTAYGGTKISEKRSFYLHAYQLMSPVKNPISFPSKIIAPCGQDFKDIQNKILLSWNGNIIL